MRGEIRLLAPSSQPSRKRLPTGKHRGQGFSVFSTGHPRELTEKEGEIDLLGVKEIETLCSDLGWGLRWQTELGPEASDVSVVESLGISGERGVGDLNRLTRILRQQWQQSLGETGEIPEPDVGLVLPGIAPTGVDGAKDALASGRCP